jgi:hypothetical protein
MKLKEIIDDRDRSIESQMIMLFGDEQKTKIHNAFKRGAKQYIRDYLPILAGMDMAKRVKKRIEEGEI